MTSAIPSMKDVMTAAPHAIEAGASVEEAEVRMAELDVHHLPVIDNADVIGVISDRDLLRVSSPARSNDTEGLVVRDVCQHKSMAADVLDPLDRVLDAMVQNHLSSVLVMNEGDLAGIFTATDACRVLSSMLKAG